MTDLQELGGTATAGRGVGEEHLMPQALVLIEQGELGSGVRPLAAHDDAGTGRAAVQINHAGQLGDLRAVTQRPVLVQGGMPKAVGHGPDSAADRLGDGVSDREEGTDSAFPHAADVGEEGFRGSGTVGADQDVGAMPVGVGDLRECLVEHLDVIRGGVGSGVTGPQPPRHSFAGVGEETQQRMEAEAAFIGRGGLFLVRVAGDQPGVEVQNQAGKFSSAGPSSRYALAVLGGLHPGDFPGRSAGRSQRSECSLVGVGEQPPSRGRGGDRAKYLALVPQHGQVRDGLAAVGEHHREVGGDASRIMSGPARPKRSESGGVRGTQPGGISEIRQQPCPGMPDHPRTIGTDLDLGTQPDTLHVESALRLDRQNPSARFIVPGQEGTFAFPP